jgi:hypothetical protein
VHVQLALYLQADATVAGFAKHFCSALLKVEWTPASGCVARQTATERQRHAHAEALLADQHADLVECVLAAYAGALPRWCTGIPSAKNLAALPSFTSAAVCWRSVAESGGSFVLQLSEAHNAHAFAALAAVPALQRLTLQSEMTNDVTDYQEAGAVAAGMRGPTQVNALNIWAACRRSVAAKHRGSPLAADAALDWVGSDCAVGLRCQPWGTLLRAAGPAGSGAGRVRSHSQHRGQDG